MSYNFTDERIASEARARLADKVTEAKRTSTADEWPFVELSGQILAAHLDDVDDEHLVQYQAYGSSLPGQGTSAFYISCNVRPIREGSVASGPAAVKPWTRDQGPLSITAPLRANGQAVPGDTPAAPAAPAGPAAPAPAAPAGAGTGGNTGTRDA